MELEQIQISKIEIKLKIIVARERCKLNIYFKM
jgi:hypothetical protein